ncbi:unnamed protein product [Calypogeia fissa]
MTTQELPLRDLVRALGWSYGTLWSMANLNTELVFADGSFIANPLKRYDSEYFNVERLFVTSYKSCAFPLGSGYVGKVMQEVQPLWLNETDTLIHHSNTSSQAHFFKVAGIQTLLCIPWADSVIELGSSSLLPQNPNLLGQIQSFLSHMATLSPKKQRTNSYFPLESSFVPQDLSAGSDDASFNGGLRCDQQVESCLSLADISPSTQHPPTAATEHDLGHGEVVAGSGESEWRLEFGSSDMMPNQNPNPRNFASPQQSLSSTFRRQQRTQHQDVDEETNFDSSFLMCPRQQMPLLSQLEYNTNSMSTSHSSSRGDDTNNLISASNGNTENQSDYDQYSPQKRTCDASRKSTAASGFTPWNATAQNSPGSGIQRSGGSQAVLRRSINMSQRIPYRSASTQRLQQQGDLDVDEHTDIAAVRHSTALAAEEVLSGHDEAAVNHMMAERRRRQKQKENFNALRALIPFVTKMDRASILGDAISYVKQLTARVEELEFLNRELEAQVPQLQRKRSRSSITSL